MPRLVNMYSISFGFIDVFVAISYTEIVVKSSFISTSRILIVQ